MIHVITGPPAAGKTSYVAAHAKSGDITIDFDRLAQSLCAPTELDSTEDWPEHIVNLTRSVRRSAINAAIVLAGKGTHDTWIVQVELHPWELRDYRELGAKIITLDPGKDIVLERCRADRSAKALTVARAWYRNNETSTVTTRLEW